MIITFNELRRIKDRLPSGSSQRIADELGISVDSVRNYFGGGEGRRRHSYRTRARRRRCDVGRYDDPGCGDAYSE